ncbi:MAG: TonB-dependent receptor domain-containing protein [Terriglobales bacterium]
MSASSNRLQTLSVFLFSMFLALMLLAVSAPLWAQKDAGAIVGLVHDASGAVVTGAKVTVTEVDRGTELALTTNDQGQYVASPLRIGRYTVTVEKQGFKKAVAGPVQVNIQDRLSVDLTLAPGMATEVVTVTGEAPQLETETSEVGQLVDQRRINALPLNGRNYAALALLGAGVSPAEPGSRTETNAGFSSNGARALQNNFLLDGIDNNANLGDVLNGSAYVVQPSVDAIAEFKVETNAYSAEFGRGNGAIMNAVIKSGTNQLHGDLFEFVRNEKFDALNRFDTAQQPYKQNQFGFTLGGPIVKNKTFFFGDYEGYRLRHALPQLAQVPSVHEVGGDFSELLTNNYTGNTGEVCAPGGPPCTPIPDCAGNPTYYGEIFDARQAGTYAGNPCGVPIGGYVNNDPSQGPTNIIPTGLMDQVATGLVANGNLPGPNVTINGVPYFQSDPEQSETSNRFDVRLDQTFSQKDNFFARFSFGNSTNFLPSPFQTDLDGGGFADGYSQNNSRGLAASEIHSFRPDLINELRFGFNTLNSHRFSINSNENLSQTYGFQGVPFTAGSNIGGLPSLNFGNGDQSLGSAQYLPAIEKQYSYVVGDNLTWMRGRHAVKFGGELRFEEFTLLEPASARGNLGFGNDFTDNPGALATGGDAFATFLLGIPDGGSITGINNVIYHRQIYAGYALDDFKVTPRLTLNLGLRYEFFSTVKEADNQQGTFDFATQSIIVPTGQQAAMTPTLGTELPVLRTGTPGLISPDFRNLAPRIGVSYQLANKLVLRSGYGIFYGGQESGPFSNPSPGFNPPFFASQSYNTACGAPVASCAINNSSANFSNYNVLGQTFVNALQDPNTPTLYSIDPKLTTPYTEQWHLGLEYQLPAETVLEVTYGGSRGSKLFGFYNGNQAVLDPNFETDATAARRPANNNNWPGGAGGPCSLTLPIGNPGAYCNPALNTGIDTLRSNTRSNYNSLQTRLEKRFSHGLQFEAAYTYSHSLDDASSASLGSANNGDFRDQTNPSLDYANSDFDIRHRFVLSYMYDLPFGRGKLLGKGASSVVNQIIGNWQLAGIFSAATGNWYTVSDTNNPGGADCGGTVVWNCARPDVVQNPNAHPCVAGTLFNTCAFDDSAIQPGTFGNAGRNIVLGPGYKTWDTSLVKQFQVHEQMHFEFRAEVFNLLNHVNYLFQQFGAISVEPTSLELGSGSLGQPQAARNPREIQLALKFYF